MICVVIRGPSIQEAHSQIEKALPSADLIELRLDLFNSSDVKSLRERYTIPMIFTIKNQAHIQELLDYKPEYVDLDIHIATELPGTKLIISYHNYEETPEDLEGLYQKMKKIPAYYYKMAVTAKNSTDAMRLCCFKKPDLIPISMGSYGQLSRILSPINYVAVDENQKTAPGQFTLDTLIKPHKNLYGLIGDPVDQSISDQTHNGLIHGSYLKMQVKPHELPQFIHYAKQLNFLGLSVTMPLKEAILPFLDVIDSDAPAVNTIVFKAGKLYGYNTDGIGAMNAIGGSVSGKHIVLIGSGGAAKAIAYEATKRGARVTIVKRNEPFPEKPYDILINCTPVELPIDPKYILSGSIVMDIKTKPKETELLRMARNRGCAIVYGYEMFIEQALLQFELWFGDIDVREKLNNKVKTIIL